MTKSFIVLYKAVWVCLALLLSFYIKHCLSVSILLTSILVPSSVFYCTPHLHCLHLLLIPFYSFLLIHLFVTLFTLSPVVSCALTLLCFFLTLFCKSNFLLFSFPLFCGCWCASCPSVLAVHLLCTRPCFYSCLFPPLLMIAKLLMSSLPIKAWVSPLPILLSLSPVSTLGHLLPTLVLHLLDRWVWRDEEDAVLKSWASDLEITTEEYNMLMKKKS